MRWVKILQNRVLLATPSLPEALKKCLLLKEYLDLTNPYWVTLYMSSLFQSLLLNKHPPHQLPTIFSHVHHSQLVSLALCFYTNAHAYTRVCAHTHTLHMCTPSFRFLSVIPLHTHPQVEITCRKPLFPLPHLFTWLVYVLVMVLSVIRAHNPK